MRYNTLGSTGLFVSEFCLGTMTFGARGSYAHMGNVGQSEADALVARALNAGVNFIDTADNYSEGASERLTGQSLRNLGTKRDEVVVATKVFGETGDGPNQRGSSRAHVLDAARASLGRLQLDHIDLYQLHGFDPATPIEESLSALDDLVRQGLVRYIGVSNWAAWQIAKALGTSALHGLTRFASVQAYYSLAARDLERELVPMAADAGLGVLAWSPLAGGLLGGKVGRESASADGTRRAALAFPPVNMERAYDVIDVLRTVADRRGATVAQVAIAWLSHQPQVSSVLLGARTVEQLDDNLGAAAVVLVADDLSALQTASALPAEYPGWMLEFWSQGRVTQLQTSRAG